MLTQITRDYHNSGYWAILQTPKHILNAVVLHLVVRALRWHIDRMLGVNFAAGDEVRACVCVCVYCVLFFFQETAECSRRPLLSSGE